MEQGVTESLRLVLEELARGFECEKAILVFRDAEVERIFVWTVVGGPTRPITPENSRWFAADAFLLDCPEASVCWNQMEGAGRDSAGTARTASGFRNCRACRPPRGRRSGCVPCWRLPSISADSRPAESLLGNAAAVFCRRICSGSSARCATWGRRWKIFFFCGACARGPSKANAAASRATFMTAFCRHCLSVDIQLDVLRRKLPQAPEQMAAELGTLQQTVRNETEELRRMVTDMRPLGVQSADLVDLMRGFAERFRNESGLALDLADRCGGAAGA